MSTPQQSKARADSKSRSPLLGDTERPEVSLQRASGSVVTSGSVMPELPTLPFPSGAMFEQAPPNMGASHAAMTAELYNIVSLLSTVSKQMANVSAASASSNQELLAGFAQTAAVNNQQLVTDLASSISSKLDTLASALPSQASATPAGEQAPFLSVPMEGVSANPATAASTSEKKDLPQLLATRLETRFGLLWIK